MAAAKVDLPVIEKGATWRHTLLWRDAGGTAIDLTGAAARLQIRETAEQAEYLLDLSSDNGGILITPLLGQLELVISAALTGAVVGRSGVYDLEIYHANGEVTRLIEGSVVFKPEVTRS